MAFSQEYPIIGNIYYPEHVTQGPSIVLLGGSNGKTLDNTAKQLAEQGFTTFALAYFNAPGLAEYLENIPLEYVHAGINYFKRQPFVNSDKIVLFGYSRGTELALLTACHFPDDVNGVIAFAPSNIINGGFPHPNNPAWTYKNKPIQPFVAGLCTKDSPLTESEDVQHAMQKGLIPNHDNTEKDPCNITDLFLARIADKNKTQRAEIPVERIRCPLLLLAGEADAIWPATFFANRIIGRIQKHHANIRFEYISFTDAGHGFIAPYQAHLDRPIFHQIGKFWCKLGGTAEGNAYAHQKAWELIINFLNRISSNSK